jgi:hypothetical protein
MNTITTTEFETRAQALCRLAQVARESGVKLMRDSEGEYWATSVSEPGWLYAVSPESCGCRGFATHRRCRHVAALHAHLGYFDPEPPAPVAAAAPDRCDECHGAGTVPATISTGPTSWRYDSTVCSTCHGVGTISAAA